ncbi:hypothetical protein D9V34_14270 [Mycetocola lacteus]|uniref:Uncharacterized protein n=1 Tax=Mycetocola lacteus TaxID=76637 RepID=A0A3L7AJ35_9MICO|nr:hypothetical protein D9V34_14270 [Mycetocola lacteus]
MDALAELPPETPVLSPRDLGGHNVLWNNGRVSGILD